MRAEIVFTDIWICVLAVFGFIDLSHTVEVHFENKDGGFFLKHTPRQQQYSPSVDLSGAPSPPVTAPPTGSILSVDRFTVFQNSQPISVRATYGPFSTKQTVPARYIVPDPLDTVTLSDRRGSSNGTSSLIVDMQELSAAATHHLDMSAHIVRHEIPRDSPVLRVLFHTGSDPGGRRRLMLARHQRVCIVLHASLTGRTPLTSACSPDGEDGVCLAQITIPSTWWPALPPPDAQTRPQKTPPRLVQIAYSVLEPREGCIPRVQIQPVTPLGSVPLVPSKSAYKELRADEYLTMMIPHVSLYPLSRIHVPVFLQEKNDAPVNMFIVRARVKSGIRIINAVATNPNRWNISVELNPKRTSATVTALYKETPPPDNEHRRRQQRASSLHDDVPNSVEIFTWLLEFTEDSSELRDGARIVWSVRYVPSPIVPLQDIDVPLALPSSLNDAPGAPSTGALGALSSPKVLSLAALDSLPSASVDDNMHQGIVSVPGDPNPSPIAPSVTGQLEGRRKLTARLEVQKDEIQAVLPISKNWEVMNTAALTGRQVSQAMKVFIVSQAGKAADVTLQSSCVSEDESVLKVSSSCTSVYVDGSEARGSVNGSVLVKYGTYLGVARFTVWMPEFPLDIIVPDVRLSQIKMWKIPDVHTSPSKTSRQKRSYSWSPNGGNVGPPDDMNGIGNEHPPCRLRYQQTPIDVYAKFLAMDHDSGRDSYFVSRRTLLRVTDLTTSLLRVTDPKFAVLKGRILQGRSMGRTEVQVTSPITGRVIGAKEIRVVNDKISLTKLIVNVVSGLQLNISPDSAIENGYIAETSVTRRLTAQYQEGLLDIELEFSDGSRTPLRDVSEADYHLVVESLDTKIVAFAPMVASHHPRVIAVGEGRGDLLKVSLLLNEHCRIQTRTKTNGKPAGPLASAFANVQVDFSASDVPHRPDFVQNDGGIPLKDENDHEPTVQARQHHSVILGPHGRGVARHSGLQPNMTPLEIGMYVLLAAFCFAIVVFVVSCVVYASKFKPQGLEGGTVLSGSPLIGKTGVNGSLGIVREPRKPRPTTMNAHDWVWLGRATLERSSGQIISSARCNNNNNNNTAAAVVGAPDPTQIRITANPMNLNYSEPDDCITSFDNPNHIELPSRSPPIDSTTYCKRKNYENGNVEVVSPVNRDANQPSTAATPPVPLPRASNNEFVQRFVKQNDEFIPPVPPHAVPLDNEPKNVDEEYRPPVPPHRNISVGSQQTSASPSIAESSGRKHHRHHHHRRSAGTAETSGGNRSPHNAIGITDPPNSAFIFDDAPPPPTGAFQQEILQLAEKKSSPQRPENRTDDAELIEFVEFPKNGSGNPAGVTVRGNSPEVKRATIVGNPMFSAEDDGKLPQSNAELEDLQLDMDYDQIMHYFDNLKESNA